MAEVAIEQLIIFSLVFAYITCGSAFTLWNLYLLEGLSKLTVIQKRYSSITRIIVILSVILICIIYVTHSAFLTFVSTVSPLVETLFSNLEIICFDAISYLMFLRFWMMYFDAKYTISRLDKEWIAFLDINKIKTNWYFKSIDKYGNIHWLIPRIGVIYCVFITISIIIITLVIYNSLVPYACVLIHLFFHFMPICVNLILCSKTPTFFDHYYMRDEMKAINAIFMLHFAFEVVHFIGMCIIHSHVASVQTSYFSYWYIGQNVYILIKSSLIGSFCFVSTGWIVSIISSEYGSYNQAVNCPDKHRLNGTASRKERDVGFRFIWIENKNSWKSDLKRKESESLDTNGVRYPVLLQNKMTKLGDIEISKKIKLPQILATNESFTLFMQHLSRESSSKMACLLSFVEYVQFKHLLMENMTDIDLGTFGNSKLAPIIPKSIIVHTSYRKEGKENDFENEESRLIEYKCRAYMLYNKYIKDNAELHLRLPKHHKKELDEQMDELDKLVKSEMGCDELFHVFDNVIVSQYQLMWESYQRFVNTGDYQLVEDIFNNGSKNK